jgi:hypothetical protein
MSRSGALFAYVFNDVLMTHPIADGMVVIAADSLAEARLHFDKRFARKAGDPNNPDWTAQFDEAVKAGRFETLPLADGVPRGIVAHARGY